jgi:deoxyhypusine synthase
MTWGKVDPETLPDSVTCYTDSTIALPLLTAYSRARHAPRPLRRLYDQLPKLYEMIRAEYKKRLLQTDKRPGLRDRHS